MKEYIISLDVALRKSGLIVLSSEREIVYKNTLVIPKVDLTESLRLLTDIYNTEFYKIGENFPGEKVFVVEDVLGYVSIKTALGIHAARVASVISWLNTHPSHDKVYYYTPNEVKHHFANKRGAKKDELLAGLSARFPKYDYKSLTEDEIDALALALYHIHSGKDKKDNAEKKPVRKTQRKQRS